MTTVEVLARLTAHWPQLGGNDQAARIRMEDWSRVVGRATPEMRAAVVHTLVTGRQSDWPPKIADWQETSRQLVQRNAELQATKDLLAIESAPAEPGMRERVAAELAKARAALGNATRPAAAGSGKVSKYDRVPSYPELGMLPPMSNEEHEEEARESARLCASPQYARWSQGRTR